MAYMRNRYPRLLNVLYLSQLIVGWVELVALSMSSMFRSISDALTYFLDLICAVALMSSVFPSSIVALILFCALGVSKLIINYKV